jgi:predicted glycoside hydrolase/deacetylase ChbG (UPF0249 family)
MDRGPRLIVNADDLGLSEGIDRAIFAGHDAGVITSTSVLTTGPAFAHAVCGLRERPALGVGVHLCLHEERPALPPERIPTLVGADGRLLPLRTVLRRALTGALRRVEVEEEYAAQVARALEAGIAVDHLDSHCHLHALPPLARSVRAVAERFGIRGVRRPAASRLREFARAPLARWPLGGAISLCSVAVRSVLGPPLVSPDRFVGLIHSGSADASWILRAVRSLEPGLASELMVHPGDGSGASPSGDHGPAQRRAELDALTSPALARALREGGVRLIDYRDLAPC